MIEWMKDATGYYKEKFAESSLDYGHDWTDWAKSGDTIVSSTWTVDSGITLSLTGITGLTTYGFISGGTVGTRYFFTNTVTWASGRIGHEEFSIVVK